jgi:hypothetical protein
MENAWMFMTRIPNRAKPRSTSIETIRSRSETGCAVVETVKLIRDAGTGTEAVLID